MVFLLLFSHSAVYKSPVFTKKRKSTDVALPTEHALHRAEQGIHSLDLDLRAILTSQQLPTPLAKPLIPEWKRKRKGLDC